MANDNRPEEVVVFGPLKIRGLVLEGFDPPPPELVTMDTHFFGLDGVSQITGGIAGRMIDVPVLIYDRFSSAISLTSYINTAVHKRIGKHDDLIVYSPSDWPIFYNCTFRGFQPTEGPKPDVAGTLNDSWWVKGILRFQQLLDE